MRDEELNFYLMAKSKLTITFRIPKNSIYLCETFTKWLDTELTKYGITHTVLCDGGNKCEFGEIEANLVELCNYLNDPSLPKDSWFRERKSAFKEFYKNSCINLKSKTKLLYVEQKLFK